MPRHNVALGFAAGVALGAALLSGCEEARVQGAELSGTSGAGGSSVTGGMSTTTPGGPPSIAIPPTGMSSVPMAPPKACGEERHTLERLPPEIIVILDRSNTMRFPVGASPNSRLVDVAVALDDVVKTTQSKVLWGLRFFPPVQGCDVPDDREVPLALDNHAPISLALKSAAPNNLATGTPMQRAVRKATEYFVARATPNPKFIVLGTDGLPNCRDGNAGADDTPGTIKAIEEARAAGVGTFLVGIAAGDENSSSSKGLSAMADAGGQPRKLEPRYYPVNQPGELAQVLSDITVRASSCVFPLKQKPMYPDNVSIRVDGKEIPKDPTNGWSWDATGNAIVVNGTACQDLQQSRIDINIQVLFGCHID
jgi:hypothetical protein